MTAAELNRLAEGLGLDVVGAAPVAAYEETEHHIRDRRERGLFADMRFTMARPEQSCHPETLLEGARTVVSAALCYYAEAGEPPPGHGRLPRYTWRDAYTELREKLDALGRELGGAYRVFVDANQHVDREAAVRAGVGFYGKNTMLITRRFGSWVVLGTLVTDVELEPTSPLGLDCGSCTLCIEACPTGALDEPGVLDATRCLSYWTQSSGAAPADYRPELSATSLLSNGSRRTAKTFVGATTACSSRATTRATCAVTRSSRPATSAGRPRPRPSGATSTPMTSCCASMLAGRSPGSASAR